jgi:hypothetical protein
MNIDFWFLGFFTVCKVNFPRTCPEPLWVVFTGHKGLPKRRRKIHLAHRAKTLNTKINREIFVLGALNIIYDSK